MPTLLIDDSSNAEVLLKGKRYQGLTEISWEESREPGEPRGVGSSKRLGETAGGYKASGSFKMLVRDYVEFRKSLPNNGYGLEPFNIVANINNDDGMLTYKLNDCRITSPKLTITGDSSDALTKEIDISIDVVIDPNGGTLVKI